MGCFFVAGETHPCPLTILAVPLCCREVALEEFEDFSNVQDSVFVRIANIPLQESIRDLRWGWWVSVVGAWAALLRCLICTSRSRPPHASGVPSACLCPVRAV